MPQLTSFRPIIQAITLVAAILGIGIACLLVFKENRQQQQSLTFSNRRDDDQMSNLRQLSITPPDPKAVELRPGTGTMYKIFPKWTQNFPCHPKSSDKRWSIQHTNKLGLLFTKVPKCASSTTAGINMRIANRFPKENNNIDSNSVCMESSVHKLGNVFKNRQQSKSFLWSVIRDPTRRAVSEFFHFQVGRRGVIPNEINFKEWCDHNWQVISSMSDYLSVKGLDKTASIPDQVQSVLDSYNFIGLVERLDESLVALQMILGLDTSYILHVSAKTSGGYDDGAYEGRCVHIPKSFISSEMEEYFNNSPLWKKKMELDVALWEAVNASLDATIDKLGRNEFNIQLIRYRQMMNVVKEKCLPEANFPCSDSGVLNELSTNNCYSADSGCGYPCIDEQYPSSIL